jgi:malonyl-CoA reductase/3-hydroxypropionate dehydrogenase (NADP+)
MIQRRETPDGRVRLPLPDAQDVASTITWLASGVRCPLGARLRGHERHAGAGAEPLQAGLLAGQAPRRPEQPGGAGARRQRPEEALSFAERHMMSGARVVLAFRSLESLGYARSMSAARGMDSPMHLLHLEPLRRETVDRIAASTTSATTSAPRRHRRPAALSQRPARLFPEHRRRRRCGGFVRDQIVSRSPSPRRWRRNLSAGASSRKPPLTYVTNPATATATCSTTSSAPRSRH